MYKGRVYFYMQVLSAYYDWMTPEGIHYQRMTGLAMLYTNKTNHINP